MKLDQLNYLSKLFGYSVHTHTAEKPTIYRIIMPLERIQNAAAAENGVVFTSETVRGGTIPLTKLIDFIIQTTYH